MEITIDLDDAMPPFSQLVQQIKAAIQSERLQPGDPLPSIRQLASDLDLNNKTVAKAYRLLERDAVIQTKGYRGTFVHPDAKSNSQIELGPWVRDRLDEVLGDLRRAGVTDSEIRKAFSELMSPEQSRS